MKERLVPYTGQAYECVMCGTCCHHHNIPLTRNDLARISAILDGTDFAVVHTALNRVILERDGATGGCTLLDGTRCSVHGHKPLVCRLFPFGIFHEPLAEEDGDAHRYQLPDGSAVYLYVNATCPGIDETTRGEMPKWLIPLVHRIRLEMAISWVVP